MNVTDADLVNFVHDELDADTTARVRHALANDAALRARHRVLADVDVALTEALDTPRRQPASARRWQAPLLAVAALVVVALVFVLQRGDASATARNDFVELRVAPSGGAAHRVFEDVRFDLRWRFLRADETWNGLTLLPFALGDDPVQLGKDFAAKVREGSKPHLPGTIPVVVRARLVDPDGAVLQGRLSDTLPLKIGTEPSASHFTLSNLVIEDIAAAPYYAGSPSGTHWTENFNWGTQERRWLPDQVGAWRVEFVVDTLPPPTKGAWPTFRESLIIATGMQLAAEVTPWSAPVDGMSARLVWTGGTDTVEHMPMAVQLRNEAGRTRAYNVVGRTQAKVPQPLHMTLVVDGQEWTQRDDLPVIISESVLMVPHAAGAVRTIVVKPDYWRRGDLSLAALPGRHTVQLLFHFEPLLWHDDGELWQGKLLTPPLTIEVPRR